MTDAATRTVIEASLERCRQVADGIEEVRPSLTGVRHAASIAQVRAIRNASIASIVLLKRVNESWAATTTLEQALASLELWWSARSGGASEP